MPDLTIDLITIQVYDVNGTQTALPQRVTPDRRETAPVAPPPRPPGDGVLSDGSEAFRASVEQTTGEDRETFERLISWAQEIGGLPGIRLSTYDAGTGRFTLLPRLRQDNAGLVTIYNDCGEPYITPFRSVFERRAPKSIEAVEQTISPLTIRRGNVIKDTSPRVLDALTEAYREASENVTKRL